MTSRDVAVMEEMYPSHILYSIIQHYANHKDPYQYIPVLNTCMETRPGYIHPVVWDEIM